MFRLVDPWEVMGPQMGVKSL